jgi:hypothetical protein
MEIHVSAAFEEKNMKHHFIFDVGIGNNKIDVVKNAIAKNAIDKLKEKCESYFKADFNKMKSIEVYHYVDCKEVILFEKQKN